MEKINNTQKLREHYFYMMEHIKQLSLVLANCTVHHAVCYSLPTLSKDDLGDEPDYIHVEALTGQDAVNMAIEHILQHEIKRQVPGVFAPRLPGVICLTLQDSTVREVRERINIINALKEEFTILIRALSPNTDTRFEIFSQALPNLIKKTVARKILIAPEHCQRIGFSWKRFYSVKKKTPEQWDHYLKNALLKGKPKGCEQGKWEQAIAIERNILRNNSDAKMFVSRRPIRITPSLNLTMREGDTKATTVVAHSPLWVLNQTPVIGELRNFDATSSKRHINERKEQLLIPRLHLYR